MSMPNIPDITPNINLSFEDSIKLLLNSISLQKMSLAHIVNAEGEKLQSALGTLNSNGDFGNAQNISCCDMNTVLEINRSVKSTIRDALKNQMLLQMELEDTMELYNKMHKKCGDACDMEPEDVPGGEGIDCAPVYF